MGSMYYDVLLMRLQPGFIEIYRSLERAYEVKHGRRLTQKKVAEFAGIKESNLSDLLNQKRPLSAHYVWKFLVRGVFSMKDIWDGKYESDREKEFWEIVKELESGASITLLHQSRKAELDPDELLQLAIEMKRMGIDPIARLRELCTNFKKPSHPFDLL